MVLLLTMAPHGGLAWPLTTCPLPLELSVVLGAQDRVGFLASCLLQNHIPRSLSASWRLPGMGQHHRKADVSFCIFLCSATCCISLHTPRSSEWKMSGYKAHNTLPHER
ncbi:Hypothetical predicted protein [Marmota monax]|uniref:Uncharacterized protein n=1 Tax=Marmota monax TaxID=9995 RepID=A0A5E4BY90_MARMO|nr:hypothetical protein GHT09_003542 [Marmota monax]VTJ73642.1 Hypothetical predicted protein [Marmota monax]